MPIKFDWTAARDCGRSCERVAAETSRSVTGMLKVFSVELNGYPNAVASFSGLIPGTAVLLVLWAKPCWETKRGNNSRGKLTSPAEETSQESPTSVRSLIHCRWGARS